MVTSVESVSDQVARYYVFPTSIRVSVRPSNIFPVLEVKISPNMSIEPNLCILCNQGPPSQGSSIRKKTCHAPNTATPQQDSSSCTKRLLPNRANEVVVFEDNPIRYNMAIYSHMHHFDRSWKLAIYSFFFFFFFFL